MAISTTLAVNVSATLSYSSLTLAAATKASSATCGSTGGANFQSLPTIGATTAGIASFTALGAVNVAIPFLLYVENYSTVAGDDYALFQCNETPTVNAGGLVWDSGVTYAVNDIVVDTTDTSPSTYDGKFYVCYNGTPAGTHPAAATANWKRVGGVWIPMGRSVAFWTGGSFHIVAVQAPTSGECKVVAIQDA